jgi:hypothetical protein
MILSSAYQNKVTDLIHRRYSCRTFKRESIPTQLLSGLSAYINNLPHGPFGSSIRYLIVGNKGTDPETLRRLGTYGFIRNPAAFIVGISREESHSLEDFGYQMESIVLKATDLDLGSCWLGGTFTKSTFASRANLAEGETIPSVVAIGIPAHHKGWVERAARIHVGSDRRLPWNDLFFHGRGQESLSRESAGEYALPLSMVRLAPSASNRQPWRILKEDDQWHFYLQRAPRYPPVVLRFGAGVADLQRIDLGIAMAHFQLSAEEAGLSGRWESIDPDLTRPASGLEYTATWTNNTAQKMEKK